MPGGRQNPTLSYSSSSPGASKTQSVSRVPLARPITQLGKEFVPVIQIFSRPRRITMASPLYMDMY